MFRKFLTASAVMSIFLAGSFAEGRFHITPAAIAVYRTAKELLYDLYQVFLARFPGGIDTTPAIVALAGFAALVSFGVLARQRRM